jgi:hypothetical protein
MSPKQPVKPLIPKIRPPTLSLKPIHKLPLPEESQRPGSLVIVLLIVDEPAKKDFT